mgnify:CR=1 FL=1
MRGGNTVSHTRGHISCVLRSGFEPLHGNTSEISTGNFVSPGLYVCRASMTLEHLMHTVRHKTHQQLLTTHILDNLCVLAGPRQYVHACVVLPD